MLELTILPTSFNLVKEIDYCDAFILGEKEFSLRMPYYFSHDEILSLINIIKERNQKVYIALNKIIHEEELSKIDNYLNILSKLCVDGIIFGDLGVYNLAKKYNLVNKLIYNPETYLTNYESVAFFSKKNIKRVSLSKEITLNDIKLIASKNLIEVEILGHGAVNMFHSKRDLITNYYKFLKYDNPNIFKNEQLYLIEEIRDDKYPIIEDQNGTHIFSSYDLCTINYLDELIESNVLSIRIDGLFKDDKILKEIIKVYRKALDDYKISKETYLKNKDNYLDELRNIENIREFNSGFLFKKTIYKGEENERNR